MRKLSTYQLVIIYITYEDYYETRNIEIQCVMNISSKYEICTISVYMLNCICWACLSLTITMCHILVKQYTLVLHPTAYPQDKGTFVQWYLNGSPKLNNIRMILPHIVGTKRSKSGYTYTTQNIHKPTKTVPRVKQSSGTLYTVHVL